ncbi:hypothetical protein V1478_008034 [Vespula squamosa]|uniref:Uncharacterized protein n=1 Tax=Vespula squamosa TaxID=30214 RepID=A0ABD2AY96_VESSQ
MEKIGITGEVGMENAASRATSMFDVLLRESYLIEVGRVRVNRSNSSTPKHSCGIELEPKAMPQPRVAIILEEPARAHVEKIRNT